MFTNKQIEALDRQFQPLYDSLQSAMKINNKDKKCQDKICPICGSNYLSEEPNDSYTQDYIFTHYKLDNLFYGRYKCGECGHVFSVDPEYCWNGIPKGIKIN